MFSKQVKRIISKGYKDTHRGQSDKLVCSLGVRPRSRTEENGEDWVEYGFTQIDPEDAALATDAEIDEWFEECMAVRIHSDHDCTGRAFTRFIDWHRNPDGRISYVHHMALDI